VRVGAKAALTAAFQRSRPEARTQAGYVEAIEENLVDGVTVDSFYEDFEGAGGQELKWTAPNTPPKFCAVHSSAALAVNTFARWKRDIGQLVVMGYGGFDRLRFEARCPSGLRGTPPTVDVLIWNRDQTIGIESKCLEYFGTHEANFADAYDTIGPPRADSRWFRELEDLRHHPAKYRRLDAAQLIKHYLGLAHTALQGVDAPPQITLLYLFWEPTNWQTLAPCVQHREEIAAFADSVHGDRVRFEWANYLELWAQWQPLPEPAWGGAHVAALRERYGVRVLNEAVAGTRQGPESTERSKES